MSDEFYRAFEDRYRGSRELIKSRLRVYLPFVEALKAIRAHCAAIDLGCGRGEWLELMVEAGVDARGVDLDDGMLAACRERGLPVERAEAVAHLRTLPDESLAIVSAFHVVEHIPFADLQALVKEALRVLMPAGLLILETPNPENLVVGASSFYIDPTHQRPLPPPLLSFLPEYHGFARTKVLRLQEAPELAQSGPVSLHSALTGVSPDYAVVAQKAGSTPEQFAQLDAVFAKPFGVDLDTLVGRYEDGLASRLSQAFARIDELGGRAESTGRRLVDALERFSRLEERAASVDTSLAELIEIDESLEQRARRAELLAQEQTGRLEHAERMVESARQMANEVEAKFGELLEEQSRRVEALAKDQAARFEQVERLVELAHRLASDAEAWARQQAEQLAQEQQRRSSELEARAQALAAQVASLEAERDALRNSRSWRVTAPLRWAGALVRKLGSGPSARSNPGVSVVQRPLVGLMRRVLRDPVLSYRLNQRLLRFPSLHRRLSALAKRAGIYPDVNLPNPAPRGNRASDAQDWPAPSKPPKAEGRAGDLRSDLSGRRTWQPLTGGDADIDELMLRVEDEIAQWRAGRE